MEKDTVKVFVGSKNPVKIHATKKAFNKHFSKVQVIGVSAPSNVSEQPIGDETYQGAKNRAQYLFEKKTHEGLTADFFVGIEGGLKQEYNQWFFYSVICIIDSSGIKSFAQSAQFMISENIAQRLLKRETLGSIFEELTGEKNIGQKEGAIGYLTKNTVTREELNTTPISFALIPFLNKKLFKK